MNIPLLSTVGLSREINLQQHPLRRINDRQMQNATKKTSLSSFFFFDRSEIFLVVKSFTNRIIHNEYSLKSSLKCSRIFMFCFMRTNLIFLRVVRSSGRTLTIRVEHTNNWRFLSRAKINTIFNCELRIDTRPPDS